MSHATVYSEKVSYVPALRASRGLLAQLATQQDALARVEQEDAAKEMEIAATPGGAKLVPARVEPRFRRVFRTDDAGCTVAIYDFVRSES